MATARILQRPVQRFGSPPPQRIAVFRALQFGDMLCAVPALRALRAAAPKAHITLIGTPSAACFVERFRPYLDELLVFPGFPGLSEQTAHPHAMPHFLRKAQDHQFDLALQMHGSGNLSNPLTVLLGAKRTAGFCRIDAYCPDPEHFLHWLDNEHEIPRFIRLMEFLGIPSQGTELEFPLCDADYASLHHMQENIPRAGKYVCVHPGAHVPSRRWLPHRFAEVADRLARSGLEIVLTGSQEEKNIVQAVKNAMTFPALDLCGKTGLGTLAALIARARLVVCNDTGISHLATAVATPSVIVSCISKLQQAIPVDTKPHHPANTRHFTAESDYIKADPLLSID